MSNYDLQSQLNQLQSELRELERYNAELRGELSAIERGVSRAQQNLEDYNGYIRGTLDQCNNTMASSHQRVIDAIEIQGEIERLYKRFKQVELANKKIRAANNVKYYDFENYRTVRKIVQGIMDNLDVNLVSNKTITKSVEVQHLQIPDYWLTCVLISVMAWKNDDRELAERAIARAIKLDKKSSCVFYMLFNLRMEREEAALKWFYTYQECELKGSDQRTFLLLFSLVSSSVTEHLGAHAKQEIDTFIRKIIDANAKASGYHEEEHINQIRHYFDRMKTSDPLNYVLLKKHCAEFNQLSENMRCARNNKNILEFILRTVNVPTEQKNLFLKNYIDELIASPNQMEQDIYDEIAYNELVIHYEGDVETARAEFDAEQTRKANDLNLIAEMIDWIYEKDSRDVNAQTRYNMFVLSKHIQEAAADLYVEDYRSRRCTKQHVTIGTYASEVDFEKRDDALQNISEFFAGKRDEALSAIKSWSAYVGFGIGAAAIAGAFFAGYWLFAGAIIGIGYGGFTLLSNHSQKKQLEQHCIESIKFTDDTMLQLFDEYDKYQQEFDEYDQYYDRIREELKKL